MQDGEPSTPQAPAPIIPRPKRKPVHRSREEEKAAYGRIFEGCGLQSDYDVLMKLGEGTFGCVCFLALRLARCRQRDTIFEPVC